MASSSPASPPWVKTSAPVIHKEKCSGKYRLSLRFTAWKSAKIIRKLSKKFDTREEALAASVGWRRDWEQGRKGKPVDPALVGAGVNSPASVAAPALEVLPQGESIVCFVLAALVNTIIG